MTQSRPAGGHLLLAAAVLILDIPILELQGLSPKNIAH